MSKISCQVEKCSHNRNGCCHANFVEISGKAAECNKETCCSSFLNREVYSSLTNNTVDGKECDCLNCTVKTCKYNENCYCNRDSIEVGGDNVLVHSETQCLSFCPHA